MTAFTQERIAQLREMLAKATPGEWEVDTEKTDGEYGSGPDCHSGYHASIITAGDKRICGTENSSDGEVHEEFDEDGCYAWDEVAARNMKAAATAVNTLPAALDEIERLSAERDSLIDQVKIMTGVSAELSRVKAKLDEAVGLLKPFAVAAGPENLQPDAPDDCMVDYSDGLVVGQLRAARSFLSRMEGRRDG